MAATVWSLWSRNKWWALQHSSTPPLPLLLIPQPPLFLKHKKIRQHIVFKWLPWVTSRLTFSFDPTGGRCELSSAGDLWHWEQIQQPGIKGDKIREASCLLLFVWLHLWRKAFSTVGFDSLIVLPPAGGRWRDQWQQRRVCGVLVGCARHAHPALQTPVSLQRLRRHTALPGQLLPHLQAAWVQNTLTLITDRPINQSIDKSMNKYINQSISPSINFWRLKALTRNQVEREKENHLNPPEEHKVTLFRKKKLPLWEET